MEILFLGTGTSHGVPPIDCMIEGHARCKKNVCRLSETDPRHRRTRSSILVRWNGKSVLIDASLDFRQQMLRENITAIDAALITHGHADHIGGIPDLRSYDWPRGSALPLYGSPESIDSVRKSYRYIFDPDAFAGGGIPSIETHEVTGPFQLFGETVQPLAVDHGALSGCIGYRIGQVAYIPDIKSITDEELLKCSGVRLLILNCLRVERPHISHLILPESMALARKIAPERCLFTHMGHDIHYELDAAALDNWMGFAWDGMKIEVTE